MNEFMEKFNKITKEIAECLRACRQDICDDHCEDGCAECYDIVRLLEEAKALGLLNETWTRTTEQIEEDTF